MMTNYLESMKLKNYLSRWLNTKGFTIIELMIALTILLIILFAFTPLLVGSIERISYAGDKSEALYQSQADLETNISYRETIDGSEVTFTFGDEGNQTIITVPGGFIDSPQVEGNATAWLSTFIPYVPSITLSHPFLSEGYDGDGSTSNLLIYIMGIETRLSDVSFVDIYTREEFETGNICTYNLPITYLGSTPPTGLPDDYDEYAEFSLPAKSLGLTNANSPYMAEIQWLVNEITVTVRTRLHIILPDAVAVGDSGTLIASPDANITWNIRNNADNIAGNINDINWSDFRFIAVTNNGKALIWGNHEEPTLVDTPVTTALNNLVYGTGKVVAVGNGGTILVSTDSGQTWTSIQSGTTENLMAINYNGSEFLIVGNNGVYLRSVDANIWELNQIASGDNWQDLAIRGVTFSNGKWIAAGDRRPSDDASVRRSVIFREDTTNSWSAVHSSDVNYTWLNDITSNISGQSIAVGNNGRILTSNDGVSWAETTSGSSHFNAIIWDNYREVPQYIIVGNSGSVLTGTPGNWMSRSTNSAVDLKGVTIRWEN